MRPSRTDWRTTLVLPGVLCVCSLLAGSQQADSPTPPLAVARSQISHGQLEPAEKTVWTVLSSDPNQTEALTLLGIVRGRQKRYSEAEALFRRVLQLDPKSAIASQNLAAALIAENKPGEALDVYKEIIRSTPKNVSARVELARLYVARGQFSDALTVLDKLPAGRLPGDAFSTKAAALLGTGKRADAAELIPQAKSSPVLAADLAEVFLEGNAPDLALKTLNQAMSGSKRFPVRLYYLKGRALQRSGDNAGAENAFSRVLARNPKSVEALLANAELEASAGKHKESLNSLMRASAVQPESATVLRPLIVEGVKAGDFKTALRAAHVLADRNPDNVDDLYLAAAAMLEGEDFVPAGTLFEKYVAQRPGDSKAYLGLGIAQLAQQHYTQAKSALEHAIQVDPNFSDAEYQLGIVADRQGSASEAVQHFERAVQLQPQHAKALASLGDHYLQAGDLEKARGVLARSVTIDPNNPKSQYNLALVLAKMGKRQEAEQHMARSRALNKEEDARKNPVPITDKP